MSFEWIKNILKRKKTVGERKNTGQIQLNVEKDNPGTFLDEHLFIFQNILHLFTFFAVKNKFSS